VSTRLAIVGLAIVAALAGCKRHRAPPVQEVWDEEPVPEEAQAIANLAPPWPAPVRGQLDNGLLTFWLHEADTPALHVRLLVPTSARARAPSAEASASVAEHLRRELGKRLERSNAAVTIVHAPDRFEIGIAARGRDLTAVLGAVSIILASRAPAGLDGARDRVAAAIEDPTAIDVAAEAVIDELLGREERVDVGQLRALGRTELVEAWEELTDPRALVLLVHAGTAAEDAKAELRKLASHWRGLGKRDLEADAVARLRKDDPPEPTKTRLFAEPAAPLTVVRTRARGPAQLVLGRVIATPNARARSLARLAQRVAQEELEVSIAFAGDYAVLLVYAPLGAKPERRAHEVVERLGSFATTRHPRQRLFQATQMWLGARVVEASLSGEDWTALLASSFDLADRDADVAAVLARDAQQLLSVDAEGLLKWTKTWLDPRGGTPGWTWAVAGASEAEVRELAAATRTRDVGR
jgi:hypothetical protein